MSFRIIDIDVKNSSEEILNKYFDFFDKLQIEQSPRDPLTHKNIQLQRIRVNFPGEVKIRKAVHFEENDEIIARLFVSYFSKESHEYEKNKDKAYLQIDVLKEFKESGVVQQLTQTALEIIKQNKLITILDTCSTFQRIWEFWEKIGAEITLEEGRSRLYLDEVNLDLMKEWNEEGRRRAQDEDVEILAFKECPEEIIEDFSSLNTEIFKLVPFGDTAWRPSIITPKILRESEEKSKKQGFGWWNIVTKEKDGNLSGLTAIYFAPNEPHWVGQTIT